MQHIVIGNFGNHSLAVLQNLIESDLPNIHFIYVETGWAAEAWPKRIQDCTLYAQSQGVIMHHLKAPATFAQMVLDRGQFPSRKFPWCAGFLKGLAIVDFLDEFDPACEALIVSGKRRLDSRRFADLQEFDQDQEVYQGRTVWHPLFQTSQQAFCDLIQRAGFKVLPHQSLECSPCIHAISNLNQLDSLALARLDTLEQKINKNMFNQAIRDICHVAIEKNNETGQNLEQFDLGCGSAWGCGE